eukprot:m.283053 g.283053  ORF g.283053 m.283053 type:complete len:50 (+) comp146298_c0_seq1:22-171(+)
MMGMKAADAGNRDQHRRLRQDILVEIDKLDIDICNSSAVAHVPVQLRPL